MRKELHRSPGFPKLKRHRLLGPLTTADLCRGKMSDDGSNFDDIGSEHESLPDDEEGGDGGDTDHEDGQEIDEQSDAENSDDDNENNVNIADNGNNGVDTNVASDDEQEAVDIEGSDKAFAASISAAKADDNDDAEVQIQHFVGPLETLIIKGNSAMDKGAFGEASRLYTRALALVETSPEGPQHEHFMTCTLNAGEAYLRCNEDVRAQELLVVACNKVGPLSCGDLVDCVQLDAAEGVPASQELSAKWLLAPQARVWWQSIFPVPAKKKKKAKGKGECMLTAVC